jgi:hypothetical protein
MGEMRGGGLLEATRCGAVASPPAVVCVPLKRKADARRVNTKSRASISLDPLPSADPHGVQSPLKIREDLHPVISAGP